MSQDIIEPEEVCAIGGGKMGGPTALCFAMGGHNVRLWVRKPSQRDDTMEKIRQTLGSFVSEGLLKEEAATQILVRIKPTRSFEEAATNASIVMESATEDTATKQELFRGVRKHCRPDALLLSNTSSLLPDVVFEGLDNQVLPFVCNAHFFLPADKMPVVEVVPGSLTSVETVVKVKTLLEGMDKMPIVLNKATDGFVVNGIQFPIFWEALNIHVEGTPAAEIDAAFKNDLGGRYAEQGPLALAGIDMDGLDSITAQRLLSEPMRASGLAPGSITERIQAAALRAVIGLVAAGVASAHDIDNAFVNSLGRRYEITGPLESADLTGLDTSEKILRQIGCLDQETRAGAYLRQLINNGRIGIKNTSVNGIYGERSPADANALKARRERKLFEHLHADVQQRRVNRMVAGYLAVNFPVLAT